MITKHLQELIDNLSELGITIVYSNPIVEQDKTLSKREDNLSMYSIRDLGLDNPKSANKEGLLYTETFIKIKDKTKVFIEPKFFNTTLETQEKVLEYLNNYLIEKAKYDEENRRKVLSILTLRNIKEEFSVIYSILDNEEEVLEDVLKEYLSIDQHTTTNFDFNKRYLENKEEGLYYNEVFNILKVLEFKDTKIQLPIRGFIEYLNEKKYQYKIVRNGLTEYTISLINSDNKAFVNIGYDKQKGVQYMNILNYLDSFEEIKEMLNLFETENENITLTERDYTVEFSEVLVTEDELTETEIKELEELETSKGKEFKIEYINKTY